MSIMKVVTHVYDVRKNLEKHIKKEFSDFELIDKRNSLLMKLLSKILFFNKKFMSSYITVIGNKVYVPELPWKEDNPYGATEVLAHEWVHMKDNKRLGMAFKLLYLMPQILTPLCLLGFWNPWFFLAILCILPFPAPWRTKFELRGYTISMACRYWLLGREPDYHFFIKQFTGPNYYFMCPFEDYVRSCLKDEFTRIKADRLEPHELHIKRVLLRKI